MIIGIKHFFYFYKYNTYLKYNSYLKYYIVKFTLLLYEKTNIQLQSQIQELMI